MKSDYRVTRELHQLTTAVLLNPSNFIQPCSYIAIRTYLLAYRDCNEDVYQQDLMLTGQEAFWRYVLEQMQEQEKNVHSIDAFWILQGKTESDEEALALYRKLYSEYVEQFAEIVDYQCTVNPKKPDFRARMERILYRPAIFVGNTNINQIKVHLDGYSARYREIFGPDSFSWYAAFDAFIKQKYDAGSNEKWSEVILHGVNGDIDAALEELRATYWEFSKS